MLSLFVLQASAGTELFDGTCPDGGDWTSWHSRDFPSGTGDWETRHLHDVHCEEPVAVEGRLKSTGSQSTNEFVTITASLGLVCQNADQPDLRCEDYEVRFCCAPEEEIKLVDGECRQDDYWSQFYSRDLPSGNGDWELRALIAQTTDDVCENPMAAEARIKGTTDLTTTEAVNFSASYGLVCQNQDQHDYRCEDYEIRFCCEPEKTELVDGECLGEGQWSSFYSRDLPSGTGDWELRSLIAANADDVCENPMAAEARNKATGATSTSEIVNFSASYGIVCTNADQPDSRCDDYEIRFCCEPEETDTELVEGECNLDTSTWTNWISRDLPSGTGDWELYLDVVNEGRPVCEDPTAVEGRIVGTTATSTTETVSFGLSGLVCKNNDQTDGRCEDYELRYCCESTPEPTPNPTFTPTTDEPTPTPTAAPTRQITKLDDGTCKEGLTWSNWLSRDFPTGSGDWERVVDHASNGICARPVAAEARVIATGATWTSEVVTFSASFGLVCENADQTDKRCEDYEIRFCCEPDAGGDTSLVDGECKGIDAQWSNWLNRDLPSGTGDWETRQSMIQQGMLKCEEPLAAEARLVNGDGSTATTETVAFSKDLGLVCQNSLQADSRCEDYEVRFCCEYGEASDTQQNEAQEELSAPARL